MKEQVEKVVIGTDTKYRYDHQPMMWQFMNIKGVGHYGYCTAFPADSVPYPYALPKWPPGAYDTICQVDFSHVPPWYEAKYRWSDPEFHHAGISVGNWTPVNSENTLSLGELGLKIDEVSRAIASLGPKMVLLLDRVCPVTQMEACLG